MSDNESLVQPVDNGNALYGIYGSKLDTSGDSTKESTPFGGYIIWKKLKDSKGNDDWRPTQYVPADNRVEA